MRRKSSRNQTIDNAAYLPEEILTNILTRLPVKSLIRFQLVCKRWRNLIKSPSFINDHLKRTAQQNPCRFGLLDCGFQLGDALKSVKSASIVSSCNGLVCLEINKKRKSSPPSLLLWNPATSAVRHVPKHISHASRTFSHVVGFGFSEVDKDFKIVMTYGELHKTGRKIKSKRVVQMFSLRRGAWKFIEDVWDFKDVSLTSQTVTLDGALFWIGEKCGTRDQVVVSFDIFKELFTVLPSLDYDIHIYEKSFYENKLAILRQVLEGHDDEAPEWIELWMLEEGTDPFGERWSWTKIYVSSSLLCNFDSFAMLGNELIMREIDENGRNVLCVKNLVSSKVKQMPIPYSFDIRNYMESLVLV